MSDEREPDTHIREIPLQVQRAPKGVIAGGFRVQWMTATDDDTDQEFTVSCGAGCGTTLIHVSTTMPDGTYISEHADIRDLISTWIEQIIESG